jgi:hypothetical protein
MLGESMTHLVLPFWTCPPYFWLDDEEIAINLIVSHLGMQLLTTDT